MVERRPLILEGGELKELPSGDTLPGSGGGGGSLAVQRRQKFTATPGQISFTTEAYTPQFVDVFLNGIHLIDVDDYTATTGNTVVLLEAADEFDVIEVISFETYLTANLTHNNLTGYVVDEHLDWRVNQGAKNIAPENLPVARLDAGDPVSLISLTHAYQIGPETGENIAMDGKTIMARNNGVAASLYLNTGGEAVHAPAFIGDGSGLTGLNTSMNILKQVDESNRTFGTGWAVGMTWNNFIKSAGSPVLFASSIPMRNDNSSWGGGYVRLEYSLDDGGSWTSLGDTGYDTVMTIGGDNIAHWDMTQIIDKPDIVASTQVRFRFQHKSYGGTLTIRASSGITHGVDYSFGSTQLSLIEIKV